MGWGTGNLGGGSGGMPYGLKIVGGTIRPKNPSHGMIWVNTSNEITGYALSNTGPDNPTEGLLWLSIGDSGSRKIVSPVSKELIMVYPIYAKQYVDGAWVDVTAMSYQGGEWVEWTTDLITKGDWKGYAYKSSTSSSNAYAPSVSVNDGVLTASCTYTNGGTGLIANNVVIDFSKYNSLSVDVYISNGQTSVFVIPEIKNGYTITARKDTSEINAWVTLTVDVSEISGYQYFTLWTYGNKGVTINLQAKNLVLN